MYFLFTRQKKWHSSHVAAKRDTRYSFLFTHRSVKQNDCKPTISQVYKLLYTPKVVHKIPLIKLELPRSFYSNMLCSTASTIESYIADMLYAW